MPTPALRRTLQFLPFLLIGAAVVLFAEYWQSRATAQLRAEEEQFAAADSVLNINNPAAIAPAAQGGGALSSSSAISQEPPAAETPIIVEPLEPAPIVQRAQPRPQPKPQWTPETPYIPKEDVTPPWAPWMGDPPPTQQQEEPVPESQGDADADEQVDLD